MPKKILIFSLAYYPKHVGGAEVAIKEITDRISPSEIEFHMVTLRFDKMLPKIEKIGNVLVHRIGWTRTNPSMEELIRFPMYLVKVLYPPLAFLKAILLYRQYRYDAFWAMMSYTGFPIVFFRMFYKKIPYILTLQEGDPFSQVRDRLRIRMFGMFYSMVFRQASFVQAISSYLAQYARDMDFQGPLEVIPNAVDTKHFSQIYPQIELDALKGKLGKKEGDTFLITTSRLVQKNAVDDVIKALALLPENVKFAILGIGPDEKALRSLAEEKGVEKRVLFLGQIDHKEMTKYLKACDIFIRPSLSEGMGNSFVEAFVAGLPVIATQEGGIADFLFDPERNPDKPSTGRAVNPRDPEGIAHAVNLFLDDPAKTAEIVSNARKLAFEKYDWNIIARDIGKKVFAKLFS
ncbi:MAG: glycosyltransferase [Parcubacteria group bacterium]|nr:glycosyltransferase [Parcubacteria group bacterium]